MAKVNTATYKLVEYTDVLFRIGQATMSIRVYETDENKAISETRRLCGLIADATDYVPEGETTPINF